MKTYINKQLSMAVACALALGFASGAARAQTPAAERDLITNSSNSGSQIWRNAYGECWHSGFGPPPAVECDPKYRPPVAQAVVVPAPPPPVAVIPPPRPVVVAVAAPTTVVQRVSLDADALFDFDKAVLRPEGRVELDGFVGKLQGVDLEKITAVGHTDRFGTDSYNQSLSQRRADAVKTYLIAKGVQSNRVQTQGMGETQPVTKNGECLGSKSAKVVACLQPNRRVDVEVVGTRTTP